MPQVGWGHAAGRAVGVSSQGEYVLATWTLARVGPHCSALDSEEVSHFWLQKDGPWPRKVGPQRRAATMMRARCTETGWPITQATHLCARAICSEARRLAVAEAVDAGAGARAAVDAVWLAIHLVPRAPPKLAELALHPMRMRLKCRVLSFGFGFVPRHRAEKRETGVCQGGGHQQTRKSICEKNSHVRCYS
jgi:hypothetical protein